MADDREAPGMADSTRTQLLLRTKTVLAALQGPPSDTRGVNDSDLAATVSEQDSLSGGAVDTVEWAKDGSRVAIATAEAVTVRCGGSGEVSCTLELPAKALAFSPKGTYLLTWQSPAKADATRGGRPPGNLVAWDASTGQEVLRLTQKQMRSAQWPSLQWTGDEALAVRATADQIQASHTLSLQLITIM